MPKTSPRTRTPQRNFPSEHPLTLIRTSCHGGGSRPSSIFALLDSSLAFRFLMPHREPHSLVPRHHGAGFRNPQKAEWSWVRKSSIVYFSAPGDLSRIPFFLRPNPAALRCNPEITGQVAETVARAQFSWALESPPCAHLPSSGIAPTRSIFPMPYSANQMSLARRPKALRSPGLVGAEYFPRTYPYF